MRMSERDRRDWGLLVFIVPLGILLMLIAGQFAMRIIPRWVLEVGMGSRLEVETAGGQQSFMQPFFNAQILTPFSWQNTYLTPNADGGLVFPPFVVLEPSATPFKTPTVVTPEVTEATPTPIATTVTPSPTTTIVATTPPPTSTEVTPPPTTCTDPAATNNGGPLPCVYLPTICTDPAATNNGGPLPCLYPPTICTDPAATNNGGALPCVYPPTTCTDPAATNNGGLLPCVYPPTTCTDPAATNNGGLLPCVYPPTTCTDPAATNNGGLLPCVFPPPPTCQEAGAINIGGPLPCVFPPPPTCQEAGAINIGGPLPCIHPVVSVLDTTDYTSPDPDIGIGTSPDNTNPGNDNGIGTITDGTYTVISLQVVVGVTPDNNYDLVIYENNNGGSVYMDWLIIGISIYADGHEYYEVFNWGNNGVPVPDTNSNIGDVTQATGTEADNQQINLNELHDPDGAGAAPQTGILIDVDNATSNPPPDTYNFVVIISPIGGGSGDAAQVDAVQATEVPIPP